jgi:hypothetical protein
MSVKSEKDGSFGVLGKSRSNGVWSSFWRIGPNVELLDVATQVILVRLR